MISRSVLVLSSVRWEVGGRDGQTGSGEARDELGMVVEVLHFVPPAQTPSIGDDQWQAGDIREFFQHLLELFTIGCGMIE